MFSTEQMADYVSLQELICVNCEKPVKLINIGVTVGGKIVTEVECEICGATDIAILDFDMLLSASQEAVINAIRS